MISGYCLGFVLLDCLLGCIVKVITLCSFVVEFSYYYLGLSGWVWLRFRFVMFVGYPFWLAC